MELRDEDIRGYWEQLLLDRPNLLVDYNGVEKETVDVYIDFDVLMDWNDDFAFHVTDHPDKCFKIAEGVFLSSIIGPKRIKVHLHNLSNIVRREVRHLRAEDVNHLICVEGMVRRASEVRPRIVEAGFRCKNCGNITYVIQEDNKLATPLQCDKDNGGCGKDASRTRFTLIVDETRMVDNQDIDIQEYPEGLKGGQQPERMKITLEGCLTNDDVRVAVGNRILIAGIYRVRENKKDLCLETYIEANSITYLEHDFDSIELTEEDMEKARQMAANPNIMSDIVASVAPHISGYYFEKMALLMQLFGGCSVDARNDIHILLTGDPGVAKSEIGQYMLELAPRGVWASGGSTSGVGLTAAAVRDEQTGRWAVEAGAMVMADKGLLIADELDKMSNQDRGTMHEGLELQRITVTKAGQNIALPCRTSVLGIMNPKYGRFDKNEPLVTQIDLPPALISRFDLIFAILDVPNDETDDKITDIIIDKRQGTLERPKYDTDSIRKYIAYAKNTIKKMTYTPEARTEFKAYYRKMRRRSKLNVNVTITPRQEEAMNRLAEAHAKARLSHLVDVEDVNFSTNLMEYYLNTMANDDGVIDVDKICSSTPNTVRGRIEVIKLVLREDGAKTFDELFEITTNRMSKLDLEKALQTMSEKGDVWKNREGCYALVV